MGFFNNIKHDLEAGVKHVEKWVGAGVKDVGNAGKFIINKETGVISGAEDTFEIPLILIAGGFALFLWNSNLGQAATIAPLVAG